MRLIFTFLLIQVSLFAVGQRIDFRNDSLFVNNYHVKWQTGKATLDSLLKTKGTERKRKGKHKPGTTERMKLVSYTYKKSGLVFNKNDYDTINLYVSIKLRKNSNADVDHNNLPVKPFKGELYIESNFMNDKQSIDDLQNLQNCSVSFTKATMLSHTGIVYCKITCQNRPIRVLFDFLKDVPTCIFIN